MDAWLTDSQRVDPVSLHSGNILSLHPNPQPHSKTRLIKVFDVTCWEIPGYRPWTSACWNCFRAKSSNWVNQLVQTSRRVNSCTFFNGGWASKTQRAQCCAQQLGKKKKKQDVKHENILPPNGARALIYQRGTGLEVKRRRWGTVDWKQTKGAHSPSAGSWTVKKKKKKIHAHTFHPWFPSATFNRTCVRARTGVPSPLAGLQSSRVKNEHVTVQRIKTRQIFLFFLPRPSPRGSIQRVTHYIGGRGPRSSLGRVGGFLPCILSISLAAAQRALCHLINQNSWPQVAHRSQSRAAPTTGRDGGSARHMPRLPRGNQSPGVSGLPGTPPGSAPPPLVPVAVGLPTPRLRTLFSGTQSPPLPSYTT